MKIERFYAFQVDILYQAYTTLIDVVNSEPGNDKAIALMKDFDSPFDINVDLYK